MILISYMVFMFIITFQNRHNAEFNKWLDLLSIMTSITPLMIACITAGTVILMRPIYSFVVFGFTYFFYFYLLGWIVLDETILLSNRINGFSIIGVGLLLSIIFWRYFYKTTVQKKYIEKQRKQLELMAYNDSLTIVFLLPMPVAPLHILYLNLIIDILPAITLSFEPGEEDIMERQPRDSERGLINQYFLLQIGLSGLVIGISAFLIFGYFNGADVSDAYAQTATFSAMALGQVTHIFNVRHPKGFGLDKSILKNKALIAAMFASIGLLLVAVYVPFMQNNMGTEGLSLMTWGVLAGTAAVVTGINHGIKKLIKHLES